MNSYQKNTAHYPGRAEGEVYHHFPVFLAKKQGVTSFIGDTCVSNSDFGGGVEKDKAGTSHIIHFYMGLALKTESGSRPLVSRAA